MTSHILLSNIEQLWSVPNILSAINTLILLATAIIVYWYTRAAQKTNELAERPVLHLSFTERKSAGATLGDISLVNIGKGIAHDIKIEKIKLFEEGRGEFLVSFYTESYILQPQETVILRNTTRIPGGGAESGDDGLMWFIIRAVGDYSLLQSRSNELIKKYPPIFCIHYKDINGTSYYSVYDFYSNALTVGEIIMQLVKFGRGKVSYTKAIALARNNERIKSPFYSHISQAEHLKNWYVSKRQHIKSFLGKN